MVGADRSGNLQDKRLNEQPPTVGGVALGLIEDGLVDVVKTRDISAFAATAVVIATREWE